MNAAMAPVCGRGPVLCLFQSRLQGTMPQRCRNAPARPAPMTTRIIPSWWVSSVCFCLDAVSILMPTAAGTWWTRRRVRSSPHWRRARGLLAAGPRVAAPRRDQASSAPGCKVAQKEGFLGICISSSPGDFPIRPCTRTGLYLLKLAPGTPPVQSCVSSPCRSLCHACVDAVIVFWNAGPADLAFLAVSRERESS